VLSQPDFLNAVAWFGSALAPEEVLDTLLSVEAELGRVRNATRWGPRTLDLDLLVYGEASVQSERLILPHPELANRKFVLLPMLELAPQLEVPGKGKVEVLYQAVASDKVERIGSAHDWSM
jgi:2-amino-4-hydroxy-6-hydroxymethyldihydropteridine diphosphokinase